VIVSLEKRNHEEYLATGADSIGHGGTFPHFYKWLGT